MSHLRAILPQTRLDPSGSNIREGGLTRRAVLAGCGATIVSRGALAAPTRPDGAVGVIVTDRGAAGMVFESEDGGRFDPSLGWHIGSNTKAMTAALYARLVDLGRCRWRADLARLFPRLRVHPDWSDVTVEELASHSAGMTDAVVDGAWLTERRADGRPPRVQRLAFVEALLTTPRSSERGRYRYANAGFVVIGAAVEEACDADWEQLMRTELFSPLGMRTAAFGAPPADGIWGRDVRNGILTPIDPAGVADNPPVLWPSGGVQLPPGEYATFLSTFLPEGRQLLKPRTLAHLLAPPSRTISYAGGWSLQGDPSEPQAVLTHNGSNTFWFATATLYRRERRGYAAIVNRGGAAGEAATRGLMARMRVRGPRWAPT